VWGELQAAGERLSPGAAIPEDVAVEARARRACLRFAAAERVCVERGTRFVVEAAGASPRIALTRGRAAVGVLPTAAAGAARGLTVVAGTHRAVTGGGAFSVTHEPPGAEAVVRVVLGTVRVTEGGAGGTTVAAHQAFSLGTGARWRLSADEAREEWSLSRGETAGERRAPEADDPLTPTAAALTVDPSSGPEAGASEPADDLGPLLALADALRARGRVRDAEGIYARLARLHPDRADVALALAALRAPPPATPWNASPALYRINVGGPSWQDPSGNVWAADAHFSGGTTYETEEDIDGTDLDPLYRTERFAPQGPLGYTLPVADGRYVVRLHFAEIWAGAVKPGLRVLDVAIEGETLLEAYDLVADVGPMTAVVKQFVVTVRDGRLDLALQPRVQNPKLNALEVFALAPGAAPPPPPAGPEVFPRLPLLPSDAVHRIDAGSRGYFDPQGRWWRADDFFDGGEGNSVWVPVAGTELGPVYQTERRARGDLRYRLPVPNGRHLVRLHFAEISQPRARPGRRVFDVLIGGRDVVGRLDLFARAGFARPFVVEHAVSVDAGVVEVELRSVVGRPTIAGIEVLPLADR
jgi:hypothetical protein